jgi:hypothetical protein
VRGGPTRLALDRFGIETDETMGTLDEAWSKYRALHNLDGLVVSEAARRL